jgi:uncharacterized protein (TIGR03435 family)
MMKRRAKVMCRTVSLLIVALTALAARGVVAQTTPQGPTASEKRFDVASVKPALSPYELGQQAGRAAASGGPPPAVPFLGTRFMPGGRFQASATLKQLVVQAFGVKDYQVEGGPAWAGTDYFAINASAGGEATQAEIGAMLKTLLAERFALRTHTDTRQASVYNLTLARSDGRLGPDLKPTPPDCLEQIDARKKAAAAGTATPLSNPIRELPTAPTCGNTMMIGRTNGASTILSGGSDLQIIVSRISSELAAPVVDRTGLTGLFTFTLEYTSERQSAGRVVGLDPNSTDTPPPPLPMALEKQLGLKLEKQIGPLPIVVIDSAEHPTPD